MKSENNKDKVSPYVHYKSLADEMATLQVFDLISENANLSEKKISIRTGLAAGLVHTFMRRVISNGWVRVKRVSAKRWLYFITPEGFMEKSRLVMNSLSRRMHTYRVAQSSIQNALEYCSGKNRNDIIVAGTNELAEIAVMNILSSANGHKLAGVVASEEGSGPLAGAKVIPMKELGSLQYDAFFVCDYFFAERLSHGELEIPAEAIVNIAEIVAVLLREGSDAGNGGQGKGI